ncbi:MAG: hypothetical protein ABL970_13620 [Nitrospira sp.]
MFMIHALRTMVLFGYLWAATACTIVSYGPEVIAPAASLKKEGVIRFFYFTGAIRDPSAKENPLPAEAKLLQEVLESKAGFAAAIVSTPPSTKGIHLNIYATVKESSAAAKRFCTLSSLTFSALPCYGETGGYLVQYDLLVDNELKKTYRYEIHKTFAQWIGLLPLVWVNGLTGDYSDAFTGTAYQFIHDSQADGYLPSP